MKYAPKLLFIAVFFSFALMCCKDRNEKQNKPEIENKIDMPEERKKDSSNLLDPVDPSFRDARNPGRKKEKSNNDLDTLRAIKA